MSRRQGRRYSQAWRNGTKVVLPPLIKSVMKRDWEGYQHFPRRGRHDRGGEPPVLRGLAGHVAVRARGRALPGVHDQVVGVRREADRAVAAVLGQLPVRRGQADAAHVLKVAEQALAAGECVIIYPEGTATRDPGGWPMLAKTGVARMALTTGVPVVPVAQWGAQEILPVRFHPAPRDAPQVRADAGRPAGGPERVRGQAAEPGRAPGRNQRDHGGHHRAAGRAPRRAAPCRRPTIRPPRAAPRATRLPTRTARPHGRVRRRAAAPPPAATPENLDSATKTTPGDGSREATQT